MSLMSQIAVIAYCMIVLACVAAIRVAAQHPDRRSDMTHWLAAAAVFAGLAAFRIGQIEDRLRDFARDASKADGVYELRAEVQVPLVVLAGLVGLGMMFLLVRLWRRERPGSRARLVLLSRFALLGLVPLFGLRLVSLHQVDYVLYSGPVRINWLIEGAICAAVGGSAAVYTLRKRTRKLR